MSSSYLGSLSRYKKVNSCHPAGCLFVPLVVVLSVFQSLDLGLSLMAALAMKREALGLDPFGIFYQKNCNNFLVDAVVDYDDYDLAVPTLAPQGIVAGVLPI